MATYNQAEYLRESIKSLLGQSYDNFTLTINNAGSTDETDKIINDFGDSRITQLRTPQTSQIAALNFAIKKGKPAHYYMVVYASCIYEHHILSALLRVHLKQPKLGGVYCNYTLFEDVEQRGNRQFLFINEEKYSYLHLLANNIIGPAFLFKAQLLTKLNNQFVNSPEGLWASWKKISSHGSNHIIKRTYVHALEDPSNFDQIAIFTPDLKPEKDIYPYLKYECLNIEVKDKEFINCLEIAGHTIPQLSNEIIEPDLVILGEAKLFPRAINLACHFQIPIFLLITDPEMVYWLLLNKRPEMFFCNPIITREPQLIDYMQKQFNITPISYNEGELEPQWLNKQIANTPFLLQPNQTTIIVRCFTRANLLIKTLNSISNMYKPAQWGTLVVLGISPPRETIDWLDRYNITHIDIKNKKYNRELLTIINSLDNPLVMCIDSGMTCENNWFFKVRKYLWDPQVAQVSTPIFNSDVPSQELGFKVKTIQEFMERWNLYKEKHKGRIARVEKLSDSIFLTKRHLLEFALKAYPDENPIQKCYSFSHLFGRLNLKKYIIADSVAIRNY